MPNQSAIRQFYQEVGPAMREFGNRFNPRRQNSHEQQVNQAVNNMTEQQFEDHMNELHMRDNIKPVDTNLLS